MVRFKIRFILIIWKQPAWGWPKHQKSITQHLPTGPAFQAAPNLMNTQSLPSWNLKSSKEISHWQICSLDTEQWRNKYSQWQRLCTQGWGERPWTGMWPQAHRQELGLDTNCPGQGFRNYLNKGYWEVGLTHGQGKRQTGCQGAETWMWPTDRARTQEGRGGCGQRKGSAWLRHHIQHEWDSQVAFLGLGFCAGNLTSRTLQTLNVHHESQQQPRNTLLGGWEVLGHPKIRQLPINISS